MAKIKVRNSDNHHARPRGVSKGKFEKVYWPYIPLFIVISGLLVLGSTGGALKAAAKHPFGSVLSYSTSMSISNLLADTNAARAAGGVGALKLNDELDAAAQANANDMATRDYWSHYTPEGSSPWVWVSNQGYSYAALAQNLAAGFSDEQSTISGWMASLPHRENLLNSSYSEVGFGYANSPDYKSAGGGAMTIVVAFYGAPQVLSAATSKPSATATPPAATTSSPPATSESAETSPISPSSATPTTSPQSTSTSKDSKLKSVSASAVTTSHLELAVRKTSYGPLTTELTLLLSLGLGIFWASRHLRAVKRLILQGERYAVGHPLTDLGLVVIAGLLFIISQTAGIIR